MNKGRNTGELLIDRFIKKHLYENCSDGEALQAMIKRAERLVFLPVEERRAAIEEFERYCRDEVGCILWTPYNRKQRHVNVRLAFADREVTVSVARVVWTACRIVPEQGDRNVEGSEEILHTCGNNGDHSTGAGACLNYAHMIKASEQLRLQLARTRKSLRSVRVQEIQVPA